jgi:hypothetical protein
MKSALQLEEELKSFEGLWNGGFPRKGNDLYNNLTSIEKTCIIPYVNESCVVLEIGPGRGFWTKKMLLAKKIICLDALSAEHNKFWETVGKRNNIEYHHMKNFNCNFIEDNSIDYLFSYDVFCHISYSGTDAYLRNLYSKLKRGAKCFIMIADPNKYNDDGSRKKLMRRTGHRTWRGVLKDYDGRAIPGRWYMYGTNKFCELLSKYGYKLINKDVAVTLCRSSPIVYFEK